MRGEQRVGEQADGALVDGARAHLHGRREADGIADETGVEAGSAERRELGGAAPGEVEARGAPGTGRPTRDRAVHEVETAAGIERRHRVHGGRRDRVQICDERIRVGVTCGRGDVARDRPRLLGRDDREHDVRETHDLVEPRQQLEPRRRRERARPFAASLDRRDRSRAAGGVGGADRAPHRAGADDPDRGRGHPGTIEAGWARRYAVASRP